MNRYFNVSGPCNPQEHYMIDAVQRMSNEILPLIANKQYFVIHAARQSGKTTLLMELTGLLNSEGNCHALYCSLENAEPAQNAKEGIPIIINSIQNALMGYALPNAASFKNGVDLSDSFNALQAALTKYCRSLDKPLVLFFDEVDCLSGQTLISLLRQLRNGFINRGHIPFVHSLALAGMRNIRDYRDEYRLPGQTLGSASPFNIVKRYLTLPNFTKEEILELYQQHTDDTGQAVDEGAANLVYEKTQGQPWLVNAIASEITENITANAPKTAMTADMVSKAIQTIILRRDTHFDSLIARLREERVRRVIEPIIIGKEAAIDRLSDDYGYVKDLGLIRDDQGKTELASPIYADVIIRALNWDTQKDIEENKEKYQLPRYLNGGVVDMDRLLSDFQVFWRENSGIWQEKYEYKEAAPQLILQAFLQRIINGGGQIIREMSAGRGRVDLCVIYLNKKYPVEMKIRYDDKTYAKGLEQTLSYMDSLGCDNGWLVVFDRRKSMLWEDRLFVMKEIENGKTVTVFGC